MPGTVTELPSKRGRKPQKQPEVSKEAPKTQTETPFDAPPKSVEVADKRFPSWPRGKGRGGLANVQEIITYWQGLPEEFVNRTNFYVNREKPVLDRLQEHTPDEVREMREHKRRYPAKYIDKPDKPWEPDEDFRMYFLERYGSGEYKIFLNDAGVSRSKDPDLESRNLCKGIYSVWDSAFPPILDPTRADKGLGILDWKHPANASYVAELRTKGILPPGDKKEEDVPNDVVKTLVDQVGTLADKVAAHETDRLVDRIAEKVNPNGNGGQSAASQIIDVMKAAREMNPPAPAAAAAPSAEVQMTGVLSLVSQIMTIKADNPMVDLYRLQLEQTREEMKEYRAETRRLQEQLAAKKPDGDSSFEGMLDKLEKIAPKFSNLLGLAGEKATDIVHGRRRPWFEELAISAVPQLAPGINTLIGAAASYFLTPKGGLGAPPQQQALPAPQANGNGNGNGQPQQQTADPLQPLRQKVGAFLQGNLKPMQKYFESYVKGELSDPDDPESKIDGEDFAIWVDDAFGDEILKDARSLGSANIVAMFQAAPVIWTAIAPYETKFREFLDQVLGYRSIPEPTDSGEEGKPVDLTE